MILCISMFPPFWFKLSLVERCQTVSKTGSLITIRKILLKHNCVCCCCCCCGLTCWSLFCLQVALILCIYFFYCKCSTVAGFMDIIVNCIALVLLPKCVLLLSVLLFYTTCWNCLTSKLRFQPPRWTNPRSELWLLKVSNCFAEILRRSRLISNKDDHMKNITFQFFLCQSVNKANWETGNSNQL